MSKSIEFIFKILKSLIFKFKTKYHEFFIFFHLSKTIKSNNIAVNQAFNIHPKQ